MADINNRVFDTMAAEADKSDVDISKLDRYRPELDFKARDIRKGMQLKWEDVDEEGYTFTGESSHKMAHDYKDGEWIAYPTLFPKSENPSTKSKDWDDFGDDKDRAYKEALMRKEVFKFGKDEESAVKFAEGSWKLPKVLQ